jgi:hypothetical protein
MTPERYRLAMILFHAATLAIACVVMTRWMNGARAQGSAARWLKALAIDLGAAAVATYGISLLATVAANLGYGRRLYLGEISGRLMGQALFGEAILLAIGLAFAHRRAAQPGRAAACGLCAAGLLAVYLDAYRVEPRMLRVRNHVVGATAEDSPSQTIRILHLTDIQTPAIGAHEERALRAGLAYRPDLIVLTGDYVQDALGRPTEHEAARDLRALMARIGFDAPLGVFATEGDVGPPCREVFADTPVRCLVDTNAVLDLPDGGTLGITGLSRGRGRERDPSWLARLLSRGPGADHRIVISHSPDFVDAMPVGVDLVLAGHTHGGQVVLPFLGPPVTASRLPRLFAGGLHDFRGIPLHVSRGIGMERGFAPPVRFLCPPEICVLDLRLSRSGEAGSAADQGASREGSTARRKVRSSPSGFRNLFGLVTRSGTGGVLAVLAWALPTGGVTAPTAALAARGAASCRRRVGADLAAKALPAPLDRPFLTLATRVCTAHDSSSRRADSKLHLASPRGRQRATNPAQCNLRSFPGVLVAERPWLVCPGQEG